MMTLKAIQDIAHAIGTMLEAGTPMVKVLDQMQRLQPKRADFWIRASHGVGEGQSLSSFLQPEWPEAIVSAVRAGEQSGTLDRTFERIDQAIELQRQVQGQVWTLAYPLGIGAAGIGVVLFFVTIVLPTLMTSLGNGEHGAMLEFCLATHDFLFAYWFYVLLAITGAGAAIFTWFSDPRNRARFAAIFFDAPMLGNALKYLHWAVWGSYMSLIAESGMGTPDALKLTSTVLPEAMRGGLLLMAEDVIVRGIGDAGDPAKQVEGDPRRDWPFYVGAAFITCEETGNVGKEIARIVPSLVKEGTARLAICLKIANLIAIAMAGVFILLPMLLYFFEMAKLVTEALSN